jgi:uncharacterized protein with ParB-like and HNH nuclease domain
VSFRSITIRKALDQIGRHEFLLPAIQREFVWSSEQTSRLFDSVLREFPIGTFLFWNVPSQLSREFRFYNFMREYHELKARHSAPVAITDPRNLTAVLDGQQRLTALNIGLLGYLATRKKGTRGGRGRRSRRSRRDRSRRRGTVSRRRRRRIVGSAIPD